MGQQTTSKYPKRIEENGDDHFKVFKFTLATGHANDPEILELNILPTFFDQLYSAGIIIYDSTYIRPVKEDEPLTVRVKCSTPDEFNLKKLEFSIRAAFAIDDNNAASVASGIYLDSRAPKRHFLEFPQTIETKMGTLKTWVTHLGSHDSVDLYNKYADSFSKLRGQRCGLDLSEISIRHGRDFLIFAGFSEDELVGVVAGYELPRSWPTSFASPLASNRNTFLDYSSYTGIEGGVHISWLESAVQRKRIGSSIINGMKQLKYEFIELEAGKDVPHGYYENMGFDPDKAELPSSGTAIKRSNGYLWINPNNCKS